MTGLCRAKVGAEQDLHVRTRFTHIRYLQSTVGWSVTARVIFTGTPGNWERLFHFYKRQHSRALWSKGGRPGRVGTQGRMSVQQHFVEPMVEK